MQLSLAAWLAGRGDGPGCRGLNYAGRDRRLPRSFGTGAKSPERNNRRLAIATGNHVVAVVGKGPCAIISSSDPICHPAQAFSSRYRPCLLLNPPTTMAARAQQPSATSLARYAVPKPPDVDLFNGSQSRDYCNSFWGTGDAGPNIMFARMRGASKTTDELRNFWNERYVRFHRGAVRSLTK